ILLVDDHQMMLQGLRQLLTNVPGLSVVGEASNGHAAIEQVRNLVPELVLLDIHLPDESGVEIARHILAEFPAIKVIALSSDEQLDIVLQALQAGISGYIIKQNGTDELVRAIHSVIDNHLYLPQELSSAVIKNFMKFIPSAKSAQNGVILKDRERLLLQLVAEGRRNKEIAENLGVAPKSVETYRSRLMKKLGCAGTANLVRYAIREGIVTA
ncbi:MAG TPA: response regulator transcription factor, partial [Candidatus Paceibacterota bacterium]|nr:response regulator transcription factor [Candidatus Paceibacterota bacterium]